MPQPLPIREDGTVIPWEKVSDALAKGEAGFRANEDVHVLNPATKEWRVAKGAKVGAYLGAGWTLASPAAVEAKTRTEQDQAARAKRMTMAEAAKANLEGYGRGLTGGLSDVVGAAVSPEWAENAKARQEAHGIPSAVGELYGLGSQVVGAGLLTGGAGAAEGAASAAARIGQLGRVLTAPGRALAAAGRAGEALVEGAGVTRAGWAGRAALAAGRGAGEGALLGLGQGLSEASLENRPLASQKVLASIGHGAILGGLTGGLLQPAGEAVSAGGRRAMEAVMGGKSIEDALEGAANRLHFKAAAGNNSKIFNEATNFGAHPERLERIGRKASELGLSTNKRTALRQVDDAVDFESGRLFRTAEARDAAVIPGVATGNPGMESIAAREALESARKQVDRIRAVPSGHHQDIATAIERQVAPLEELLAQGKTVGFRQMHHLRSEMYKSINWARDTKAPQYLEMRELAFQFDNALTKDMQEAAASAPALQGLASEWASAKENIHDLLTLRDAYRESVKRMDKNRAVSPTDYLMGALGTLAGGVVAGPAGLLAGAAAAGANKLMRERGPAAMAKLLTRLAKTDTKMTKATAELLESAPMLARAGVVTEGVRALHKDPVSEFKARRDHLLAATQDPEKQIAGLSGVMTMLDGHHDMQADVADLYGRANAYLLRHLPKPMANTGLGLTPKQMEARVPRSEMMEWLERSRTADDPVGEIAEDLAKGRVSQVKIQTMRELDPDLVAEWGQRMELRIAERAAAGNPLPYRRRVVLSLMFGFAGDTSLEPVKLAQTQSTHALIQQQAQAMKGQPPGAPMAATMNSNALAVQPMKFH